MGFWLLIAMFLGLGGHSGASHHQSHGGVMHIMDGGPQPPPKP